MPFNDGIITAPVSIDDVKQALGEPSNDLATLCKSEKINVHSKYKPVHLYNKPFVSDSINTNNNTWNTSKRGWWLGNDSLNNGVFIVNAVSSFDNLDNLGIWQYNPPYGGSASPYRLSDFVGYNSDDDDYMYDPIHGGYIFNSDGSLYLDTTYRVRFYWGDEPIHPNNTINITDIMSILSAFNDKFYPAICIYNETKKQMKYLSSNTPINPDDFYWSDEIPDSEFAFNFNNQTITNNSTGQKTLGFRSQIDDVIKIATLLCPVGGVDDNYFYTSVTPCIINNNVTNDDIDVRQQPYYKYKISNKSKPTTYTTITVDVSNVTINKYYADRYYRDVNNGDALYGEEYIEFSVRLNFGTSYTKLKNIKVLIGCNGGTDDDNVSIGASTDINTYNLKQYITITDQNIKVPYYTSAENARNEENTNYTTNVPICNKIIDGNYNITRWNIYLVLITDRIDHDSYWEEINFNFRGEIVSNNVLTLYAKQ